MGEEDGGIRGEWKNERLVTQPTSQPASQLGEINDATKKERNKHDHAKKGGKKGGAHTQKREGRRAAHDVINNY